MHHHWTLQCKPPLQCKPGVGTTSCAKLKAAPPRSLSCVKTLQLWGLAENLFLCVLSVRWLFKLLDHSVLVINFKSWFKCFLFFLFFFLNDVKIWLRSWSINIWNIIVDDHGTWTQGFSKSFCIAWWIVSSLEIAAAFKWQVEKAYLLLHKEALIPLHFLA